MSLTFFTCWFKEGVFSSVWCNIRIILKSASKPSKDSKSYQPITLLPSLGKHIERLVVPQLLGDGVKNPDRQLGFTLGKSTPDTVISVRKTVTWSRFPHLRYPLRYIWCL